MEGETIVKITRSIRHNQERMMEEKGIYSSITDENIKEYLEQVIGETKNHP